MKLPLLFDNAKNRIKNIILLYTFFLQFNEFKLTSRNFISRYFIGLEKISPLPKNGARRASVKFLFWMYVCSIVIHQQQGKIKL